MKKIFILILMVTFVSSAEAFDASLSGAIYLKPSILLTNNTVDTTIPYNEIQEDGSIISYSDQNNSFKGGVTHEYVDSKWANKTPATQNEECTIGEKVWDVDYIYICTSVNFWERVALSTW